MGRTLRRWDDFCQFVEETYGVKGEWKYYGRNFGWALRFRKGGKALVSLYPGKRSCTAQLILAESVVRKARRAKLGAVARTAIRRAYPYPEGRWVFVTVTSAAVAADVKKLLLLKSGFGRGT